jgi:hypothetical protein
MDGSTERQVYHMSLNVVGCGANRVRFHKGGDAASRGCLQKRTIIVEIHVDQFSSRVILAEGWLKFVVQTVDI